MKALNLVTLILVIIGGLLWGWIGLTGWNFLDRLAGEAARIVYVIVGLSALWQLVPLSRAISLDETEAIGTRR